MRRITIFIALVLCASPVVSQLSQQTSTVVCQTSSNGTTSCTGTFGRFRPDDQNYLRSIGLLALPGVIFAIFSVIFFFCFACLRCLCDTCGKRKPTKLYQKTNRRVTYIGTVFVVALVVVGCAVGWNGNKKLTPAFSGLFDAMIKVIDEGDNLVVKINDVLTKLKQPAAPSSMTGALTSGKTWITDKKDRFKVIEDKRAAGVAAIFAMCFFAVVFMAIAAAVRAGPVAWIAYILFWIGCIFVWLSFAVHLVASQALSDVCGDQQDFVKDPYTPPYFYSQLHVQCPARSVTASARSGLYTGLNSAVYAVASATPSIWPSGEAAPSANLSSASPTPRSEITRLSNIATTLKASTDSRGPDAGALILSSLDAYDFVDSFDNCSFVVKSSQILVGDAICDHLAPAVNRITIGSVIAGSFLIIGIIFLIRGIKQYSKQVHGPKGYPVYKDPETGVNVEQAPVLMMAPQPGQPGQPGQPMPMPALMPLPPLTQAGSAPPKAQPPGPKAGETPKEDPAKTKEAEDKAKKEKEAEEKAKKDKEAKEAEDKKKKEKEAEDNKKKEEDSKKKAPEPPAKKPDGPVPTPAPAPATLPPPAAK